MEAYILHINKNYEQQDAYIRNDRIYSAWCTEKQAITAAVNWLKDQLQHHHIFPWKHKCLEKALLLMIEDNHHQEVIDVINQETFAEKSVGKETPMAEVRIRITKSTFKGSPFE